MDHYILPCHPSQISLDPLGLCDEESPTIWGVVNASLHTCVNISQLPEVIEDLSYSIHSKGDLDTGFLKQFLLGRYPDPLLDPAGLALRCILSSALQLPALFPAHTIPYLSPSNPVLRLSHAQIKSLLAHQILNTLSAPKGNTWGCTFTCWYSEPQPLATAISGYLTTLFDYFDHPPDEDNNKSARIEYRYLTAPPHLPTSLETWTRTPMSHILAHLHIEATTSTSAPFPNTLRIPCTLIASNKEPGFGASCTQEELVTAACPPLLILGALLVSPPVPADAALLVSGVVPLAHWRGQGRDARPLGKTTMEQHTFLFLDASELDIIDAHPQNSPNSSTSPTSVSPQHPIDLHPPFLLRDLTKLQNGLFSLHRLGITSISAPLWGAGAFGGDPVVKSLILGMAGAREGVRVHVAVDQERMYPNPFDSLREEVQEGGDGEGSLVSALRELKERYQDGGDGDEGVDVGECFAALYGGGSGD